MIRLVAMKSMTGLVAILAVVATGCGVAQTVKAAQEDSTRKKLHQDTVIQGYPCAKGYTWFYADGKLDNCWVSQETQYGEALIPRGSLLYLKPDGRLYIVMLAHDSEVAGVKCSGGNWLLGPAEGAMTSFYSSGKLLACSLAEDQVVQGVPCRHDDGPFGILYGHWVKHRDYDLGIEFYESGKLKSCGLSKDFDGQKKNTLWKSTTSTVGRRRTR
jgi:hypothetical protein